MRVFSIRGNFDDRLTHTTHIASKEIAPSPDESNQIESNLSGEQSLKNREARETHKTTGELQNTRKYPALQIQTMSSLARNRLSQIATRAGKFHKPKPQLKEAAKKSKWNIVRGDKVQVIGRNHPERGKQGIIKKVLREVDRVIVEGVNMGPRSIKGDKDKGVPGKVIQLERTMHYSNVQLVDPIQGVPTRIYKKILPSGEKVRISKKSGAIIPKPDLLTMRRKPISSVVTESCTSEDDAWESTYVETRW